MKISDEGLKDKQTFEYITWCNDYCFDCKIAIKSTDEKHDEHLKLSQTSRSKVDENGNLQYN